MLSKTVKSTPMAVAKLVAGVILLFASAQISIPLQPVPITLQTVAVMLIGLTYRPKEAFHTLSTYLILGALGLPVFASFHSGIQWLFGKTGGYLFGFLLAAVTMSSFYYRAHQNLWTTLLTCFVGLGIIYGCGVLWLAGFIGFKAAVAAGVTPFIVPGIIKAGILSALLRFIKTPRRG